MRKVCGARRSQLIAQFLGESTVLALLAAAMAVFISERILPYFNSFVQSEIEIAVLAKGNSLLWLFVVVALVSVCSGSYPALVLSAFKPVKVLKGKFGGAKPSHFRTTLVIAQCAFSILFIIMALVVQKQLQYCRSTDLGYGIDRIIVVPVGEIRDQLETVKTELRRHPNIQFVSSTTNLSNYRFGGGAGQVKIPGQPDDTMIDMCHANVDDDYLNLFEIEILEGRNFSRTIPTDATEAFILNETAVKMLGWEKSAIGREFGVNENRKGKVIGVIKDFHQESLHESIKPLYLFMDPEGSYHYLCARILPNDMGETIAFIKATISKIAPNAAFNYQFYDEIFDQEYQVEQKLGRLFNIFAALAVAIACLGLFGLVSLTVAQRTKEIGIRKVLGASPMNVTTLLTQDYAKWLLVAGFISWPLAWHAANQWLQSFAYRIDLNWGLFMLASALLLGIVLLTVGYQAFRAANANPVEALRYE
jgi:putative ABC transport system permease protein